MQYQGGKEQIAKHIAAVIGECDTYVEPFCGGISVAARIKAGTMILADANEALITLYRQWQDGWRPNHKITHEEYKMLQGLKDPNDPYTAFAGFGLSFGGKWFGGFAKDRVGQIYQDCAHRGLDKKLNTIKPVFLCQMYQNLPIPDGATVYCDPPYAGTTGYSAVETFDSDAFWAWAEALSTRCTVYVSEYQAPPGWVSVWSRSKTVRMRSKGACSEAFEHLFQFQP